MAELIAMREQVIEKYGEGSFEADYIRHVFAKRTEEHFRHIYAELMEEK